MSNYDDRDDRRHPALQKATSMTDPTAALRTAAFKLECIRKHFGAARPCDEYDDGRELCGPCFVRVSVAALATSQADDPSGPPEKWDALVDASALPKAGEFVLASRIWQPGDVLPAGWAIRAIATPTTVKPWPKDGYDHDAPSPGAIDTGTTTGGLGSE